MSPCVTFTGLTESNRETLGLDKIVDSWALCGQLWASICCYVCNTIPIGTPLGTGSVVVCDTNSPDFSDSSFQNMAKQQQDIRKIT